MKENNCELSLKLFFQCFTNYMFNIVLLIFIREKIDIDLLLLFL